MDKQTNEAEEYDASSETSNSEIDFTDSDQDLVFEILLGTLNDTQTQCPDDISEFSDEDNIIDTQNEDSTNLEITLFGQEKQEAPPAF